MPSFNPDDYVQVNERLEKFRADHPTWGLISELLHHDEKTFIVRATVTDDSGRVIATGLAEEIRGTSLVNKTSPLENGETSAWGRALANLGYDVRRSIASREEMEKVQRQASPPAPTPVRAENPGAAEAGSPAPPPPPGQRSMEERRAWCFSAAKDLSPEALSAFKAEMAEQGIGMDFSVHTEEQVSWLENKLMPF